MEIPRHWRLKLYNAIKGEECGNCGLIIMARKRPVCECGLVFEHEGLKISGENRIASLHKVIGKNMGVYFTHELPKNNSQGIQVEMPKARVEQCVE